MNKTILQIALLTGLIAGMHFAHAASVISISSITASEWGDRYGNGPTYVNNRSGINTSADVNDPSQWVFNNGNYGDEWMATPLSGALNSKVAWISFDFGAVSN